MNRDVRAIYFFSFLLAFCSLFYELIFAQVLSVCLGGTKNQYFLIISLFTCSLGFGSIIQGKFRERYPVRKTFFIVELSLTLLGGVGPFLITWLLQPGRSPMLTTWSVGLSYFFVTIIGFLSGFEIPCLFSMLKGSQGKILAFDYFGMLVASVSFPFFFLPVLGTAASGLLVSGSNLLALVWLRSENPNRHVGLFLYAACVGLFIFVVASREGLNEILSSLYLGVS